MIKAIETEYNGYRFRSRLEARWALFFDLLGIEYEYEPEGLELSNGKRYLPDFYLPYFKCFFEVKNKSVKDTEEGEVAIKKISDGARNDSWAGLICFGDPHDHDLTIYCQEVDDGGGGPYEGPVLIGLDGYNHPVLHAYWDHRERTFFDTWGGHEEIPVVTNCGLGNYAANPYRTQRVINAEIYARQARFEFGETPITQTRRTYND